MCALVSLIGSLIGEDMPNNKRGQRVTDHQEKTKKGTVKPKVNKRRTKKKE